MSDFTPDLHGDLMEIAYRLMSLSNQLHDKHGTDPGFIKSVWYPLSFYANDILTKCELIKKKEASDVCL